MTDNGKSQILKLKIKGMHCASCEFLIEKEFKKIQGVEKVKVSYASGTAKLLCSEIPEMSEFEEVLKKHNYSLKEEGESSTSSSIEDHAQTLTIFVIMILAYMLLKQLNFLPTNFGVKTEMSFAFIFIMGVVASLSTCLAVTGGLLVAVAAKYDELHENLNVWQKFKPHIYFNLGRIISYTFFGALIAYLGSFLSFSSTVTGWITIVVSVVMIILGFQLLKIFSWVGHFMPKMPKFLAHKIDSAKDSEHWSAPFFLGAATFFLPCGFTQALQLYVLSKGSVEVGALTMLAFSVGTLPVLLSLGTVSSFIKGEGLKYFLKIAGVLVVLLGVLSGVAGLRLMGIDLSARSEVSSNVEIVDGKQIVEMKIIGLEYYPKNITVKAGVPVVWKIDSSKAIGCGASLSVPSLNILEFLSGEKTIEFTPENVGTIPFTCSMGMTSGSFNVTQ